MNSPLHGMAQEEIIDLAVRAEKSRQRTARRWALAIAAFVAAVLIVVGFWMVWELNRLYDAQLAEIQQAEFQAQLRATENERILAEIQQQLVPRSEFIELEAQMQRANAQLREQKAQLREQGRQLRRQSRQLAQIAGGVAALQSSG